MTSNIAAVVFDWAGTMVDFGCVAPVEALLTAFAAEGVAIDALEARRDMGLAKRDHVRAILAAPRVRDAWTRARGAAPADGDVDRLHDALEPLMRAAAAGHSTLIPGAAALFAELRARGVRVGSSTGYTRMMMTDILPLAAAQGYAPEVVICAGETPAGRPSPLMMWKALAELRAWPARACVKVDDAEVGVAEGVAAGVWSIGLAASGNGVGLSLAEYEALSPGDRAARVARSAAALAAAGADYVIDTVADLPPVLAAIEARIAAGEGPRG
jgi:phosphonoacetaldehyde hydrolase